MKNRVPKPPSYLRHKTRNKAFVLIRGENGKRRQVYLPGLYNSPESHRGYRKVVAAYLVGEPIPRGAVLPVINQQGISIEDLAAKFLHWAEGYYRKPDGTQTGAFSNLKYAARPLLQLYRDESVNEFSPLKLKQVREQMVSKGWSRPYVNSSCRRLRQIFKWGISEELVHPTILQALQAVAPLKRGRTKAPEPKPILPVEWSTVEATLPHLSPQVRAMVLAMWHSGMRPNEICQMRTCDIDRSGPVWIYVPQTHKTEHHGKSKIIALGPQAQEILRPFLRLNPTEYLFQPEEAEAWRQEQQRKNRKTKVQPSQVERAEKIRKNPKRKFRIHYNTQGFNLAISRACEKAGPEVEHWSANQLRHACATRLRQELGSLEAVRTVLGHSDPSVTTIYAERDTRLAVETMAKFG